MTRSVWWFAFTVVLLIVPQGLAQQKNTAGPALETFKGLEGSFDIAGGTAHIPVMEEAMKRIMTFNPRIRITVTGGGSGVGVQKVGEGLVQIGNTGRALSDDEVKKYGLKSFPFAIDGVAVVVHPTNSVRNLTSQQVRDIFAGKITNWKQVGGSDASINLYGRDEASGTRKVFWKKALGKGDIAKHANVVPSNGAMKVAVGRDPAAIGYLSIGHVDKTVAAVALEGVEATQENAQNGKYKVTRKLYMNTKGDPTGLAKAFIDYIRSPECADLIKSKGYIPTNE
jgi:phosphate transport system substrate-binding protein